MPLSSCYILRLPRTIANSRTKGLDADKRHHRQSLVANNWPKHDKTSIPGESSDQRKTRRETLSSLWRTLAWDPQIWDSLAIVLGSLRRYNLIRELWKISNNLRKNWRRLSWMLGWTTVATGFRRGGEVESQVRVRAVNAIDCWHGAHSLTTELTSSELSNRPRRHRLPLTCSARSAKLF